MSLIADIKTYIVSENKFVINALKWHHQSGGISRGKWGWGEGKLRKRETRHAGLEGEEGGAGNLRNLPASRITGFARIYVNI